MKYERILTAISDECWAILPSKLEEIVGVIEARMNGVSFNADAFSEIEAARRKPIRNGRVAVLPIRGTISPRANAVNSSIGASAERLGLDFDILMDSPDVGGVILDIDSPGGSVRGLPELTDKIFSRRGEKPIVAVANHIAASAAFMIGAAADELIVSPSGSVGSVGVLATHIDQSAKLEKEGIKATFITSAKFKGEGNQAEPLSDEALKFAQSNVQHFHNIFVKSLARSRNTTENRVNKDFGEGRMVNSVDAVERNMADRVATFEQIIAEMTGTLKPRKSNRAMAERRRLQANRII